MYIIPGYATYYQKDGATFITSKIKQNTVKLTESSIQEEFSSLIEHGGCPTLSTPLEVFLHDQELLASEEEISEALCEVKKLLNEKLILTVMPTEGCNFRCTYCYEDHIPISMSQEMIEQLKSFIAEKAPYFRHIHISWFGGEPTLCKDTVLEVSSHVQMLQKQYGFCYTASMTTNGYMLNEKNFCEYFSAGITCYQITLDGFNHDKTRPHISGKGTLKPILENLSALSNLPMDTYKFYFILRHNILAGDTDFRWYDYLKNLFGKDPRFAVSVRAVNDWGGQGVEALNLLQGDNKSSLIKMHEAYLSQIGLRQDSSENELFGRICYAAFPNGYIFRSNGKIEKCSVALNHPQNLVGCLNATNGVVIDEAANESWCYSDLKSECYSCPDVLSCLNMQCRYQAIIYSSRNYFQLP